MTHMLTHETLSQVHADGKLSILLPVKGCGKVCQGHTMACAVVMHMTSKNGQHT